MCEKGIKTISQCVAALYGSCEHITERTPSLQVQRASKDKGSRLDQVHSIIACAPPQSSRLPDCVLSACKSNHIYCRQLCEKSTLFSYLRLFALCRQLDRCLICQVSLPKTKKSYCLKHVVCDSVPLV